MKKIYLLLFLLFSGIGFAQVGNYEVTAKLYIKPGGGNYGGSCRNDVNVTLVYDDGPTRIISEDISGIPSNNYTYYSKSLLIPATRKPVKIQVASSRNWRRTIGGCGGNGSFNDDTKESTNFYSCLNTYSDIVRWWDDILTIENNPVLTVIPPGTNNELPTDRDVTIRSHTGFLRSEYNWEYTFTPELPFSWVSMPQFYGESSFTTNAKGILGPNAALYHGKEIHIRQRACNVTSSAVQYIVRQSAPEIASHQEQLTKCFDTQDGKLIVKFNRALFSGEKISFSIREFDLALQQWKSVICSSQGGDGDEIILDATNSYTFPCDFSKGSYGLAFTGYINGSSTGSPHTELNNPFRFDIGSPVPVDFSLSSTNVNCYGGKDGTLTITASGGSEEGYQYSLDNGVNWIAFSNVNSKEETLTGLFPVTKPSITYSIIVKDKFGCITKINDKTKVLTETISEPLSPLELNYTLKKDPTFFNASNGKLVAAVSGGTIFDNNSYEYEWRNSAGDKMPVLTHYDSVDKTYYLTLENAPDGEYKLTVKDKNYANAKNGKEGCSVIESSQKLTQPEKIEISLNVTKEISCNTENLDALSTAKTNKDGTIEATVSGGIKFIAPNNNGLPYIYIWQKYNTQTQVWDTLKDYKTAIAVDLEQGNYALNVIDANGISQGTFSNTEQLTKVATEKDIAEPTAMLVDFDKKDVSCFDGENGWAKASIRGGNSNYQYTWYIDNKSIKNDEVTGLKKGTYYVDIKDLDKGCFVRDSILIEGPKAPLKLTYSEKTPPTFAGASDGVIVAVIEGGTSDGGRYNYVWKNNKDEVLTATEVISPDKFTIRLEGLPEGIYTLSVTDKNYDEPNGQIVNCSKLNDEVELTEPKPLKVTFTRKEISCNTDNEFGDEKDTNPNDGKRDESQDGVLIAHVTGGVTLKAEDNNGLPYYYTWKKQNENGIWETLAIKDSIAPNLSHGNYAFNVEGRYHVILGTYTNGAWIAKDSIQFMQEPPKLSVSITKGDVFCFGGNDGWAEAKVVGGTLPYTYAWSNDEDLDDPKNTFLKKGKYTLLITDGRGCTAYDEIDIKEPTAALSIEYKETLNPSFYKATNGKIVVEVKGGTIDADKKYWFEWKNSKGIVQTSVTTNFSNDIYTISLNGVPEETYTLTVRDANYDAAINKATCTVLNSEITLDDPDPLEVSFEVVRSISCNVNNEFGNETDLSPLDGQRDESQDGILVANVKGGIQLEASKNNGLPYYYTWKKLQKDKTWAIWNDQDETAENLSDGTYALNVKDANDIVLGTYVNNILVEEKDAVQDMPEPAKLILTFTKLDVGCSTGDDGWAEAHVSGGTEPYTYEWTNGSDKPKIEGLTTNNYFVKITDGRGCVVQGSIFVGDPNGIFTTEEVKNPTCYKGNDGSIELNVTGGNLPYTYEWNTGATTKDLTGLIEGNYEVTITCPDCCVYKKRFTLKDPGQIVVDLGKDRTLCSDQVLDLDASISDEKAEYVWSSSNGFTSNEAKVSLTKAGTYQVKVISSLGCIAEDEIVIKTTQTAISSEFLLSSQAYLDEEVILVNTSEPFGESTEWILPKGVTIVEQKEKYITLKFNQIGSYTIGLQQTQGECFAVFNKNITVEKRSTLPNADATSKFIIDFIVTPNPSNGNFKALVNLENNSAINLRLFSGTGQFTTIQKKDSDKKKYEIDFNTTLGAGMYILVLETEQQTLVKKIIIY